jgi:Fe-S-cluster containining protein
MPDFALTPLYQKWVDKILDRPIYTEPRSTCNNCAMCDYQVRPAKADYQFNPNVKCCAFHPILPNYLIGAILCDDYAEDPDAKAIFIRGALTADISPRGIAPPYLTRLYYLLKPFGKFEQALCPFYIKNRVNACSIYKYRNARCSTWFCKHEKGLVGALFWQKLDNMLTVAENELAGYCIRNLQLTIPDRPNDLREKLWGNWTFREPEFFQECWKIVEPLAWEEVLLIGGEKLNAALDKLFEASDQLKSKSIPKSVRIGEFTQEDVGDGLVRIWSYSQYNPVDLRKEVVDVLPLFDGRPVEEVLDQIRKQNSFQIDEELLLQLTDYKILVST